MSLNYKNLNASTFKPVFKKYFLTYKWLCINGESLYLTVSALNRHDLVCNNFLADLKTVQYDILTSGARGRKPLPQFNPTPKNTPSVVNPRLQFPHSFTCINNMSYF